MTAPNNEDHAALAQNDPLIGTRLGDYAIARLIGRGGMARVYEGYDEKLNRRAAVKVIDEQHESDPEILQRFLREAQAAANLDHPNIVSVYQFGKENGVYYLAMKLIEGRTLLSVLKRLRQRSRHLEPDKILRILSDVGAALDYAHRQGVIHRDIKPGNIMLTDDDRAILMDFGLLMHSGGENTLGTAFGTPRYIAPEQAIASHRAVPQSDIYSLGVILYEMASGRVPFEADSPMSLALSHINNPPPPPRTFRPDLPPSVEAVIMRALEKQPGQRWRTCAELVTALRRAYEGIMPPEAPPPGSNPAAVSLKAALLPDPPEPGSPARSVHSTDPAASRPTQPDPPSAPTPGWGSQPMNQPLSRPISQASQIGQTSALVAVERAGQVVPDRALRTVEPRRGLWLFELVSLLLVALFGIGAFALTQQLSASAPTTKPKQETIRPNEIRLVYDSGSFAIFNATNNDISLDGMSFVRAGEQANPARFEVRRFGETASKRLQPGQCLRILIKGQADTSPALCGPQTNPIELSSAAEAFWLNPPQGTAFSFQARRGDTILVTCSILLNTCEFSRP